MIRSVGALCLARCVCAQQAGTEQAEEPPSMSMQSCSGPGSCDTESVSLTLDSQRRWLHNSETTNCFEGEDWDGHICPDPQVCADKCMLEGVGADAYSSTYGVSTTDSSVEIKFIVDTEFGKNIGSRLYAMDGEDTYKMFSLKNREISFDVDVSSLPCGLNAALYLVEMPADGGKSGTNTAGAKYGTGYCDAQCPHGLKFIDGEANIHGWKGSIGGMHGSCCAEMDLFEANKMGGAFTAHPCRIAGSMRCDGKDCGDADSGHYYQGVCDKDGCDFNTYRLGAKEFYGPGMTVDPQKPFTVVIQFLTNDGSDGGDLVEIRRYFVQDGQKIDNPEAQGIDGVEGNSITNAFCAASKEAFHECRVKNNPNGKMDQFNDMGGLKAMGDALARGMVLVLSLWDDPATAMHWLDSASPSDLDESVPGVKRGPCPRQAGKAEDVETSAADAFVRYSNIKYGPIGSTTDGVGNEPLSPLATAPLPDTPFASAEVSKDGMSGFKKVKAAFDGANNELPTDDTTATSGKFDCFAGSNNWKMDWSDPKKKWCCANQQIGCDDDGRPSEPFDCQAGFSNWKAGWSDSKKEYCCANHQMGCEYSAEFDSSVPAVAASRFSARGVSAAAALLAAAALVAAVAWRRSQKLGWRSGPRTMEMDEASTEEPLVA